MRYLSVCSGIEAATVAWHPLGWELVGVSEIEAFPSAVLAHHYPSVPNHGDFTKIGSPAIDLLVGGTPCQSFSVAGLRGGLADDRGNLALEFLRLAGRTRPRWVVWENVPGVFSSVSHVAPDPRPPPPPLDMGRDGQEVETEDEYGAEELHAFNCFLAGLSELGYGFSYRVFDAQFFGVAQRRRRVFVVGYLGEWAPAAAVFSERSGLRGDPPPSRTTGQEVAGTLGGGSGQRGWADDLDRAGAFIPEVAHALRAEGFDASEDGTGRGTPLIAFSAKDHGGDAGELAPTLRAGGFTSSHANGGVMPAIAFHHTQDPISGTVSPALGTTTDGMGVHVGTAVRRLTPRECERLQGFPDDYTLVPVKGKPVSDGPRYRALGNSMAVPVMRWIGERIALVEAVFSALEAA